ncbi:hypothetical protein [Agromyces luteolus]|uniref:Uncharacterized protein n=1 Tax=Agromyces luteolus TaxID=88373 RepID=A0A7C9LXL7_9MICO|nr:hypothetical protein [Agromyces luteolus]MUN08239.1 hypothetical protein [Agromyces luteolus]
MFTRGPGEFEISDAARELHFSTLTRYEQGYITVACLTWRGRPIPFEYVRDERRHDGAVFFEAVIRNFGYSVVAEVVSAMGRADFADADDADQAFRYAVEAVLAYEPGGEGLNRRDGYNRLSYDGRLWTLGDFGDYFTAADIAGGDAE